MKFGTLKWICKKHIQANKQNTHKNIILGILFSSDKIFQFRRHSPLPQSIQASFRESNRTRYLLIGGLVEAYHSLLLVLMCQQSNSFSAPLLASLMILFLSVCLTGVLFFFFFPGQQLSLCSAKLLGSNEAVNLCTNICFHLINGKWQESTSRPPPTYDIAPNQCCEIYS